MWERFVDLSPAVQTLLATLFTWGMTAAGAGLVFTAKKVKQRVMDGMLAFAGGVMIAASFWSLLEPAIEMAESGPLPSWVPAAVGFMAGGFFLWGVDKLLPHLHPALSQTGSRTKKRGAEGLHPQSYRRSTLLVLAITLHNIPEGFAIGVAFGTMALTGDRSQLVGAVTLAIGMGLQNFPEGTAVSMPLRREGMSRGKAFWYGQLSGFVEPVSALLGLGLVSMIEPLLPYALAFAAGAMIFVVAEEVIPGSQEHGNKDLSAIWLMIGFTVMMVLDVAFG
ncbi:Metal transporter, ZIP family [Alkalibacterium sp. AK22]|uniref:ZIP family metal transporter n=1 Tax=Alkalibacterium sp. AK22 TaxID=1229520 RepID=UPI0004529FC8|nr:ZIP family metal transporter [Alkalibacterium sp. AK22]EXJ24331.1 Metal transporter, ZIP family [Alkalibacterium sp. AK22]